MGQSIEERNHKEGAHCQMQRRDCTVLERSGAMNVTSSSMVVDIKVAEALSDLQKKQYERDVHFNNSMSMKCNTCTQTGLNSFKIVCSSNLHRFSEMQAALLKGTII